MQTPTIPIMQLDSVALAGKRPLVQSLMFDAGFLLENSPKSLRAQSDYHHNGSFSQSLDSTPQIHKEHSTVRLFSKAE